MSRLAVPLLALAGALSLLSCSSPRSEASVAASRAAFERLTSLQGEWVGEGLPDVPGPMTVTYRLTGGGSAIIETLFPGTPTEMVTLYTLEGGQLMLTHYCSMGNQPRMRAETMQGDVLVFRYAGGANIDPWRDDHMHDARFEFVSENELLAEWTGWSGGRPAPEHVARVRFTRKS